MSAPGVSPTSRSRPARVLWTELPMSRAALNCVDPIEDMIYHTRKNPNPEFPALRLSLGDLTRCGGCIEPPEMAMKATQEALASEKCNGYGPPHGLADARKAIAEKYTRDDLRLTEDDVIMAAGCTGALTMAMEVLVNPYGNVLVPSPGYPVFRTQCESLNIEWRPYNCVAEKDWEIDFSDLESKIDVRTRAILICNPSNPTGAVYSREHLLALVRIADKYRVPIIADEILEQTAFTPDKPFVSVAEVCGHVPTLICSGLTKSYALPGWRVGWIILVDRSKLLDNIREGLLKLTFLTLGPATINQKAVRPLLFDTPQSYHDDMRATLKRRADLVFNGLSGLRGLTPYMPASGMYLLVKIDHTLFDETVSSDLDFCARLWEEKSVQLLPGDKCFAAPGYARVFFAKAEEDLTEALQRVKAFCQEHAK
eukprot:PhM_4_TR15764/c0_g1_i1/m.96229/K00815/TAT; tyrosine aminotransferase